jgi:hypothetical protein
MFRSYHLTRLTVPDTKQDLSTSRSCPPANTQINKLLMLLRLECAGLAATDTQCAAIVQQIGVNETRKWGEWKCHGSRPYLICVPFLLFH